MTGIANEEVPEKKKKPREKPHYVNNRDFSTAVVEYVTSANEAKARDEEVPQIGNYIGDCFVKITEGLSHKPNFMRYTYRDEMIMDAQENCVRAIMNFDVTRTTRTGLPNAFAYFTQITWFAFLRRIAKEKKQQEIKEKVMDNAGIGAFAEFDGDTTGMGQGIVERVRHRTQEFRTREPKVEKTKLVRTPRPSKTSSLEGFFLPN